MIDDRYYFVYINTNKTHNVFYTGITNNLLDRSHQHKTKANKNSFTAKYKVDKLVYYETFDNAYDAIAREKQIKGGSRKKKITLMLAQLAPRILRGHCGAMINLTLVGVI